MKNKTFLLTIAVLALLGLGILASQAQAAGALEAALQSPALDEQVQASLKEKAEMAARMAADQAAGSKKAAPKQPGVLPDFSAELSKAAETPPTGIFEGGEAIIHGYEAAISNHWQGLPDGLLVQVFAGALADDPQQGVLYVAAWTQENNAPQISCYLTPSRDGAARILSAENDLLTVQAAGGSTWTFDWRTGVFK